MPAASASTPASEGLVLHAAQRLHGGGVADRRRLPGDRHGGDAGRDGLSADRPFRPADHHQRRARRGHELRRRLYQLLPRRRDRRRDRHAADAAVPRRLLFRAQAWRAGGAPPAHGRRGGSAHDDRSRLDHGAAQLSVHAAGAGRVAAGRGGLRGAVLLSGAEGLVADGRRHFACGAAGHRARLCRRPAARGRRFRGRPLLRAVHRLSEGEQPGEGGHGDGHRVFRHVRARAS